MRDFSVFIRDDLEDTGSVPNNHAGIDHSPDIILWHQQFDHQQAQDRFGTASSYGTFEGRNLIRDSDENFMYVRMKNRSSDDHTVTAKLWELTASLLAYPGAWNPSNLVQDAQVTASGKSGSGPAITLAPVVQLQPPKSNHCYMAEIIPQGQSSVIPSAGSSYWRWYQAMRDNNTLALCNYYIAAPHRETITNDDFSLDNTRTSEQEVALWLMCKTLPLNCAVSVWTPEITDPQAKGHIDTRSNPFVRTNASKDIAYRLTVPAAPDDETPWSTPLTVSWKYPDGVHSQPGQQVRVEEYYILGDEHLQEAVEAGVDHDKKIGEMILMGSTTYMVGAGS